MKNKTYPTKNCKGCGTEYAPTGPADSFCSALCKFRYIRSRDKVNEPLPSGCWEWKENLSVLGYGRIRYRKDKLFAHRLALEDRLGRPLTEGECSLHNCDNPACVNPDHLFIGTVTDNNVDRARKGRNRDQCGENHNFARLTTSQVLDIRSRYTKSTQAIAEAYKVSQATISDVIHRRTWKHV